MINHLWFVTASAVPVAIGLILLVIRVFHRFYSHEPTKALVGSASIAILVAALFPVILNHLWAMKRDRYNRLRTLGDQHFAQLRPVLRTESSRLQELAANMSQRAYVFAVRRDENRAADHHDYLWPDGMSPDLQNHFPVYDKSKRDLLSEIEVQEEEFRNTLLAAEQQIRPTANLDAYWKEVVAMSFIESCTGRGEGIKLRVTDSGFSFVSWGSSGSSSGGPPPPRPSPDQVAAFRVFRSLTANAAALSSQCNSLKRRAAMIISEAQRLSRNAQLESEGAILKGSCAFLESDSLSD